MEAQGDPFRRGRPTLQTSLTHPELPPRAPAYAVRRFVSLCFGRVFLGEVFWFGREVQILYMVRLRTRFVGKKRSVIMPCASAEIPSASHSQKERDSRTLQKILTSPTNKITSPMSPPFSKSEPKLRLVNSGDMGGSSGWVREVWRVGRSPFKGSPCASKVFLPFPFLTPPRRHPTRGRTSRLRDQYR